MRTRSPLRRRVLAVVLGFCALLVLAAAPGPAPGSDGSKAARPIPSDALAPPTVPGLTPWGAVILSILMLSSSTLAMYGGRLAALRPARAASPTDAAQPQAPPEAPRKTRAERPLEQPWRRRRVDERRQAQVHVRQGRRGGHRGANSQTMKRRLASGCRGPLRKT